jgi:hypothetical protein
MSSARLDGFDARRRCGGAPVYHRSYVVLRVTRGPSPARAPFPFIGPLEERHRPPRLHQPRPGARVHVAHHEPPRREPLHGVRDRFESGTRGRLIGGFAGWSARRAGRRARRRASGDRISRGTRRARGRRPSRWARARGSGERSSPGAAQRQDRARHGALRRGGPGVRGVAALAGNRRRSAGASEGLPARDRRTRRSAVRFP